MVFAKTGTVRDAVEKLVFPCQRDGVGFASWLAQVNAGTVMQGHGLMPEADPEHWA